MADDPEGTCGEYDAHDQEQIAARQDAEQPPPPPPPPEAPAPAARSPQPAEVLAALRAAAAIDWTTVDLDLPEHGFVCGVGAEIGGASATVKCDCGKVLYDVALDGESRARCPACHAMFRHVLLIQREDQTPATPSLLIDAILREAGVR